jgi:hypothetical protein
MAVAIPNGYFSNAQQANPAVTKPTLGTVTAQSTPVTAPNPSWTNGFADSVKNLSNGGTANGLTGAQNLNNVLQQPGNTQVNNPVNAPIIKQANADTAAQSRVTTPTGSPAPTGTNTGGTTVPNQGGNVTTPWMTPGQAMQSAQEQAKSRIDQLLAGGRNAFNTGITSAKNAYDETNQTTADNRTIQAGQFNETHNPFSGQTGYAQAMQQRDNSIADTATNADYNNKVNQISQTWQDLQTAAPEQQQALQDQLYQQAAALGIQGDQLNATIQNNQANQANQSAQLGLQQNSQAFNQNLQTNQFNSQQQNQGFNQNLATNQYNQAAQNQQFNQNLDTQKLQQAGQQFAAQNKLDWTKLSVDQQNMLGQLAISQQNANTSSAGQANTAANDAARIKLDQGNQDLANANAYGTKNAQGQQSADYLYKQSQAAHDSALAVKAGQDSQKNAIDTAYKDAVAMAQKDTLNWANADTPEKQAAMIDQYYQKLKPAPVSDADISSYLNK